MSRTAQNSNHQGTLGLYKLRGLQNCVTILKQIAINISSGHFARSSRLINAAEYASVFAQACKQSNQHFTLLCRNNDLTDARLGLAIAKKQLRLAVSRNRLKRLIRESFRLNQDLLTGLDIVVLTRKSVLQCTNEQILAQLEKLWQKLVDRCKKSC